MTDFKARLEEVKISVILRAARAALGISQTDLANELEVSQSTIARCERGVGPLPSRALLRAMRFFSAYGIDISGVLEDEPSLCFSENFFEKLIEGEKLLRQEAAKRGMEKRFGTENTD
jgi:transcriptional regulator with XRE-family HTH domain